MEKMTGINKLNQNQKNILGEYMKQHPNLAKNMLPNCAQGKATCIRLWEELSRKLNAVGPPSKDAKMWRKVFADQKYQAKKKLSFNKASKSRTGGGPYEEKFITEAEECIIEASGLEVAVDGIANVVAFGSSSSSMRIVESNSPKNMEFDENTVDAFTENCISFAANDSENEFAYVETPKIKKKLPTATDPKLVLLEKNLSALVEGRTSIDAKLDRLLEIQERLLVLKEIKYKNQIEVQKVDLEIKKTELYMLNCRK